MATYIFGHKNPDTDSICSAIAFEHFKTELGENVKAMRLGEVNKETNYALSYFDVQAPDFLEKVADEAAVILVDHNEFQQSVDNIGHAQILEVIDHHRIANFETSDPLYMRVEPVGCTATIIKDMYEEKNVSIPKHIAGLLLSAIISDSLLFKSPTCTDRDIEAAKALAKIAEVDVDTYGLDMLKAGADVSDQPVSAWISGDAKEFMMHDSSVEIGQLNTVDPAEIYKSIDEIKEEIQIIIENKGLSLFLFVVTDILNNDSEVLAVGPAKDKVESAFDVTLSSDDRAVLKGVVSRKKQVVPNLTRAFES